MGCVQPLLFFLSNIKEWWKNVWFISYYFFRVVFFTKTYVFFTILKIMWVDSHIQTIIFVCLTTFLTLYGFTEALYRPRKDLKLVLNGKFSQSYSLSKLFLTKTNGFLIRWKIMWVDRHGPMIVLDLGEGSLTMIVCNDHCNHRK